MADDLSTARRKAGAKFARAIERQLADLGMADARVDVRVEAREPGVNGADEVRLLVAPNPGGTWGSVAETASGGELSRISLAIRVAAQERSGVPMLVFDEVDAGVGGRTARAVGEKLAALSQTAQVICITHLAQVAALADHHFRVVKEPGDPTVTRVEKLEGDAVDVELARMLGGEEDSEEALQLRARCALTAPVKAHEGARKARHGTKAREVCRRGARCQAPTRRRGASRRARNVIPARVRSRRDAVHAELSGPRGPHASAPNPARGPCHPAQIRCQAANLREGRRRGSASPGSRILRRC